MKPIKTYIDQILHFNEEFPKEALAHIIDRESESKPHLYELLDKTLTNHNTLPEDFIGHIFALYLLAQFRDPKGFDYSLAFLRLPEPENLLHDLLTQSYPAVIASCYSGNPETLYALIRDTNLSFLVRVIGLVAASIIVNQKALDRKRHAEFLLTLLKENNPKFLACVAQEAAELHLGEVYDDIIETYGSERIDEEILSRKFFDTIMQSEYVNPRKFFLIDDVFEELSGKEY